jgi:hypothetical protein
LAVRGHDRLVEIVRSTPWLMAALDAARGVDPPDWLIGAGSIRTAVWNALHGFAEPTSVADIDVAFFDPGDLRPERDAEVELALREQLPTAPWEATNQAAVHLWFARTFGYDVPPLRSSAEAVATWPETATCVGIRLTADDALDVVAPYGVDDLLGLIHRRNPARVSVEEYERRLASKRITDRWPGVRVMPP